MSGWNWHLVPTLSEQVVKASSGHIPQPFLISVKELACCGQAGTKITGLPIYEQILTAIFSNGFLICK
jgi:hypothetical protein